MHNKPKNQSSKLFTLILLSALLIFSTGVRCGALQDQVDADWDEITKVLDQAGNGADDDDDYKALTDEEEKLLNDPSTPQDVKDQIMKKLTEELYRLIGEIPEKDLEDLREASKGVQQSILDAAAHQDL